MRKLTFLFRVVLGTLPLIGTVMADETYAAATCDAEKINRELSNERQNPAYVECKRAEMMANHRNFIREMLESAVLAVEALDLVAGYNAEIQSVTEAWNTLHAALDALATVDEGDRDELVARIEETNDSLRQRAGRLADLSDTEHTRLSAAADTEPVDEPPPPNPDMSLLCNLQLEWLKSELWFDRTKAPECQ